MIHGFVPGRIEVLGKHTDYAGGRSLVCAIDRGFSFTASARTDSVVRAIDTARGELVEVALDPERPLPNEGWTRYVATVTRRIARDFPNARTGVDLAFESNLPPSSGLSSSSALVIMVHLALAAFNEMRVEKLAAYLGAVETGVGTHGGSQDHAAILHGQPDALTQLAFDPLRVERTVPFPADLVFIVAYSGVTATKTGSAMSAYNAAANVAGEIVARWRAATDRDDLTLGAALVSDPGALDRLRLLVDGRLRARLEQFARETFEIVPDAADALAARDLPTFRTLVDLSQEGAEHLLGNQVPETAALVTLALGRGAIAASAFGAGFGGSVWALAPTTEAPRILRELAASYATTFPAAAANATFFLTRPSAGALARDDGTGLPRC
jgi:galactokinase